MEQTTPSKQAELTTEQYDVLERAANDALVRAVGTDDGTALDIAGEKIQLPNLTRALDYDVDYQTATYELGPFDVEMELDNGQPTWTVSRRVATDGGIDTNGSRTLPDQIETLSQLKEGDKVSFSTTHLGTRTFSGEVTSLNWKTTEGPPDAPHMEVISAHVNLNSWTTKYDGNNVILHAARPATGDWPDDEPIVIDDLMHVEDADELDHLTRIERASGVKSQIVPPETVAEVWGLDRGRVHENVASRAISRIELQWTECRRPTATALVEAGFRTRHVEVRIDGDVGGWQLSVTHTETLGSLGPDAIDVDAAARDFCNDVLAEICELMRVQMNSEHHGI